MHSNKFISSDHDLRECISGNGSGREVPGAVGDLDKVAICPYSIGALVKIWIAHISDFYLPKCCRPVGTGVPGRVRCHPQILADQLFPEGRLHTYAHHITTTPLPPGFSNLPKYGPVM